MTNLTRKSQTIGRRPALVIVDIINGFTDTTCPLGGHYPDVIEANKQLLTSFRAAKLPVFFTTVVYKSPKQARIFRDRLPALEVLTPQSKWVQIHAALNRHPHEPIIEKQWASAFFKTDLDKQLQQNNVDSLIITGLTTSGCVRATAVDGLQYDYKVFIPREAVGDRNAEAHTANLFDLHAKYADVVDTKDIQKKIERLKS